ncbi:aminoglycoside phosphotransferase family protein (plasmid) [Nocardia sp. NBC_01377]|uniref:phosphotransferase family protein n=1 Tax=Nocardia sp. NBC_01377 TaxID=2903595 RepID=UPI002F907E7D
MDYRPIERRPEAFQQPPTERELQAMAARIFGVGTRIDAAVEIADGMYNNTFRVDLGAERPVILRVAPTPARQHRIEPELMRNEHATVPYLAPIAPLMPQILGIDFTHTVLGRDYMFQTLLDGVPAPAAMKNYQPSRMPGFFRQIGGWTQKIHEVSGPGFGRVAGPLYPSWSEALSAWFECAVADLDDAGLDSADAAQLVGVVDRHREVLDQIRTPRLLHGDLWIVNLILAESADAPTITGIVDNDRTWWGDPEADWPIYKALRKPGTARDAFWDGYGRLDDSPDARWRRQIYHARHTVAIRLELSRDPTHDADALAATYRDLEQFLGQQDQ